MKDSKAIIRIIGTAIVISIFVILVINLLSIIKPVYKTDSVTIRTVSSQIQADGKIASQNEADLHFQTAGKIVYLPVKEGSRVYQGETIARLDTYALQRQLQLAANTYQTAKNTTDQALENNQAGIIEGQQRLSLDTSNKQGYSSITEATVVYDAVRRIVDNDLLAQNSAQINEDIANYSLTLASLVSPINGIITHEDVTVSNINVTPVTTFRVSDPDAMIFRAQVDDRDIDYVSVGSPAEVHINGTDNVFNGTVVDIHPDKITLPNGDGVYEVDVQSQELLKVARFDQSGFAQIESNTNSSVYLVPVWTVLNGDSIWVSENGKNILKKITRGKTHGDAVEITSGLDAQDRLIVNPKSIIDKFYSIL